LKLTSPYTRSSAKIIIIFGLPGVPCAADEGTNKVSARGVRRKARRRDQ